MSQVGNVKNLETFIFNKKQAIFSGKFRLKNLFFPSPSAFYKRIQALSGSTSS